MFEIATGTASESLAGAINKFARSELRREIDRDKEISRYESSDEGMAEREADNFAHVKQQIQKLKAEPRFWLTMISSREWDENSYCQMSLRFLNARQEKEKAMKRHGPFIVWASQISRKTREEWRTEMERSESEMLELAIEFGRRTRAERD